MCRYRDECLQLIGFIALVLYLAWLGPRRAAIKKRLGFEMSVAGIKPYDSYVGQDIPEGDFNNFQNLYACNHDCSIVLGIKVQCNTSISGGLFCRVQCLIYIYLEARCILFVILLFGAIKNIVLLFCAMKNIVHGQSDSLLDPHCRCRRQQKYRLKRDTPMYRESNPRLCHCLFKQILENSCWWCWLTLYTSPAHHSRFSGLCISLQLYP